MIPDLKDRAVRASSHAITKQVPPFFPARGLSISMNEADSPSINLDELRLLPDWLREEALPPSKQYAAHDGRGDDRGAMGDRRGGGGRAPYGGGSRGGGQRDQRGGGQSVPRGGGQPREQRGGSGGRDRSRPGSSSQGGGGKFGRQDQRGPVPAPLAPVVAAPVQIEFLPDARCLANIVKQIRSTHMAYPLFGTARMFLQEPERHLLKITLDPAASQGGTLLYQLGENGPVASDRQVLERIAFESMKDRFYVEQTVPKDPPKGNFTNVARCRLSGTLLGPTNYHGYQPALRALYESRFSRRMPFEEFRQSIEVVSDPAVLERWKLEASTVTTIQTREGEPPTVLASNADARVHFRQHYLEGLLRSGTSFELPGSVARSLPEAGMMMVIRQSNENELRYPAQFVQHLRKGLQDAGLHIFKHRKRIVYVAVTRPSPFTGGAVSDNVAAILEYIGQKPLCTRKDLASKFLPRYTPSASAQPVPAPTEDMPAVDPIAPAPDSQVDDPSAQATTPISEVVAAEPAPAADPQIKAKAALAADLRFLVQAGHIIEFHNGTFDLPLSAKTREEPTGRSLPKPNPLFTGNRKADAGQVAKQPVGAANSATQIEKEAELTHEPTISSISEEDGSAASPEFGSAVLSEFDPEEVADAGETESEDKVEDDNLEPLEADKHEDAPLVPHPVNAGSFLSTEAVDVREPNEGSKDDASKTEKEVHHEAHHATTVTETAESPLSDDSLHCSSRLIECLVA